MKILMINTVSGVKSTGRICTDLASELITKGNDVKIIYGRDNVPDKYEEISYKFTNKLEVLTHVLQARLFDGAGFGSYFSTKKVIKFIEKYDPDIIHLHNLHGYYINVKLLFDYLNIKNKKIIWTLHDMWPITGHTPYCDTVGCQKWINGCYSCPLMNAYPKTYKDRSKENWNLKKHIFGSIGNIIIVTPSEWLNRQVKKSYLSRYNSIVISNGVDTKLFRKMDSDFKSIYNIEDKIILLGVATAWDKNKGLYDFYELSKLLDDNYRIVLVGLNESQMKNLPDNIIGIQKTNSIEDLVKIYSDSDILLNLSYCENYPTINIEALACDTNVLTYNTGGSPEIVRKYGGMVVEKGNIKEVKSKIENYKKISPNFCREENDIKYMIEQYMKLYNEVL